MLISDVIDLVTSVFVYASIGFCVRTYLCVCMYVCIYVLNEPLVIFYIMYYNNYYK